MDTTRFDFLTKDLASSTTRRHALAGLGALALAGAGIVSQSRAATAEVIDEDARRRCLDRCNDRGGNNQQRQRRKRCRRECENR